jgi:hypothetical protein
MFRIEVKEINSETRDVEKWVKLRDKVEGEEGDDKPEYGYVTRREFVKDERVLLTQEVENVDLKALIRAINRPN